MIAKSTQTSSPTSDTPQQPANKKFKIAIIIMAVMLVIAFALSAFAFIKYHNLKSQLKDRQTKLVLRTFKKVDVNNQPTSFATPIKEGEDGYLNFNKLLDSKWFGETVLDYFKANKETLKVGFDNFGMCLQLMGFQAKLGQLVHQHEESFEKWMLTQLELALD
ncbi:hypothetical protein [Williamsoniiplasma lucivorax]|uniref:Uncharacterized protein n=1 Tax=Williamsoniiplasma lucivorax TaxID=209274 RepID=A0A2S5RA27_9MOLU|nr:hypothetical protein [Williamsoniiplasma lucivorax]PPE04153.1 hypothetical protein ELUCI_v1c09330 [Williamsoniiplasma lucivorax]